MTQIQINELFGISISSIKEWKADSNHKKHNLGIVLTSLDYQEAKDMIDGAKESVVISTRSTRKKKNGGKDVI